jgi:hypothetical protein
MAPKLVGGPPCYEWSEASAAFQPSATQLPLRPLATVLAATLMHQPVSEAETAAVAQIDAAMGFASSEATSDSSAATPSAASGSQILALPPVPPRLSHQETRILRHWSKTLSEFLRTERKYRPTAVSMLLAKFNLNRAQLSTMTEGNPRFVFWFEADVEYVQSKRSHAP